MQVMNDLRITGVLNNKIKYIKIIWMSTETMYKFFSDLAVWSGQLSKARNMLDR